MADAQATLDAPLKNAGAKAQPRWVETAEGSGLYPPEKVLEGSNEYNYLTQTFDTEKKYMFELAEVSSPLEHPSYLVSGDGRFSSQLAPKKFIKNRNLIFSSQVVWNGQRRNIRYYDGCTTIFVDKQPQDRETINGLISQTRRRDFVDGKLGIYGYEKMLLLFMSICSWNIVSPFRTKTATSIFRSINSGEIADATASKIDQMEEALKLAREASDIKVRVHGGYLGVPEIDYDSGNDLTDKEIRALYREQAVNNPAYFIETYGNKSIETKYFIKRAWSEGKISNKFNPNKATWGTKNTEICDISGLKSSEAIEQRLFEYSQTKEGSEFPIQLKALYS